MRIHPEWPLRLGCGCVNLYAGFFLLTDPARFYTLLSAKFSWSNSLRSWFRVSRDKICATFNMPRSAPETLNNGEQSLDFTYYEQTTNRFWSPHLAESRVRRRPIRGHEVLIIAPPSPRCPGCKPLFGHAFVHASASTLPIIARLLHYSAL